VTQTKFTCTLVHLLTNLLWHGVVMLRHHTCNSEVAVLTPGHFVFR